MAEDLSCIPKLLKQTIGDLFATYNLKAMLLTKTHVPNKVTQNYVSDVVANEVIDSGNIYTAGGVSLSNASCKPDPNDESNYFLDADDITLGPGTTISYRYVVVYRDMGTGNHAVNPIIAQLDALEEQVITNGINTIIFDALGLVYFKS